ncbi:hypothetical protein ACFQY0_10210 [Haloferula chungangensis]|uniref:WD40 repeat domain-containing protein n=1 Tax=Haloferula chungangensis TaxID=1048331 RepID=A0ABW2L7M4_9BACT
MRLLISLFALSLASCAALETETAGNPVRLRDHQITEASGLAVSRRDPELLWVINDSGAAAIVHLTDTQGMARGSLTLKGVKNTDWEDLAAFTFDGKAQLLIADTGDNNARREHVTLHIIAEPRPTMPEAPLGLSLKPDWSIRFRYEEGPRDCEGVAIDSNSQSILLVTKRDKQPAIYQLPLRKSKAGEVLTAKRLGPIAPLLLPVRTLPHPYATQPTALDISADGRLAAVLTYRGVYLFRRLPKESWAQAFAKAPEVLGAHGLSQAEALAFSPDGHTIFVTSEGKRPRLVSMPIPRQ